MSQNNPTAVSAVVGQRLSFGAGPGRAAALLKNLTMPAVLVAFATYLLVGIVTMKVPEGTAFPGPQFFPLLIMAGLYAFAVVLGAGAVREHRAESGAGAAATASVSAEPAVASAAPASASAATPASAAAPEETTVQRTVRVDVKSLAWVVGSFLVFSLVLNILGWIIAAGLLFWCIARGFGSTRWLFSLVVGLTVSSLSYIAFDMALGMSLPSGILGWGF
ncbi:tripartite tricarboxylate transporter TctB family protein [Microbacterium sp. 1.5R]|uniref:tripartite tricarboxylate transporter TctB family protein n=1 Tax=Microbacterium sp. 1.5R TaxID=1916917 RepID=UPI0011A5F375|nr:tripartite tricarboxylate transporter TctB family protein [Microbacterium sp. 1.5R]